MGKATRSLSGASQKKYIRDLLRATEGLGAGPAEDLAQTIEREVAQIRVRLPIPERGEPGAPRRQKAMKTAAPAKADRPSGAGPGPKAAAVHPPEGAAFDPFAFSVVVVVTKEGRAGLIKKLAGITAVEDLKALAKAQHVALPETAASLDEIRAAIADGALQRIANRRAAAS